MAIQKEIWQDHIEGNLFKNNEFLLASTDVGQYVLQGHVVHIPQAGATANVVKNRTSLPATVVQRTDSDITYALDEFTTDPILIPNAETYELSYNKRESVLGEYESSLRQTVADNLLIDWAPTGGVGTIVRTTGSSTATTLTGTTGNRCRFTVVDLKNAQLQLNKQNVPMEGRYALISAAYNVKDGVLGRLFGFNIMMRGGVVTYTNDGTPVVNPYGSAPAASDNDGVLCWQIGAVERALGQITFFERIGDPTLYGDVYSVSVRMGARIRRADGKGIISIVQAAA